MQHKVPLPTQLMILPCSCFPLTCLRLFAMLYAVQGKWEGKLDKLPRCAHEVSSKSHLTQQNLLIPNKHFMDPKNTTNISVQIQYKYVGAKPLDHNLQDSSPTI